MRSLAFSAVILIVPCCSGCGLNLLRNHTNDQAAAITSLNYQQVLDNLALAAAHPEILPYFTVAQTQITTLQRQYSLQDQIGLDFISGASKFVGMWLLDKQLIQPQFQQTDTNTWQPANTVDPDRLASMACAYQEALGRPACDCKCHSTLQAVLKNAIWYRGCIPTHWFCVGMEQGVPDHARYVGHYGGTYVWVNKKHVPDLTEFTLIMLDIASLAPGFANPNASSKAKEDSAMNFGKLYADARKEFGQDEPALVALLRKKYKDKLNDVATTKVTLTACHVSGTSEEARAEETPAEEPSPFRPRLNFYIPFSVQ